MSDSISSFSTDIHVSESFNSTSSGFFTRYIYEHENKATDIVGISYNARNKQYILLDMKGIISWTPHSIEYPIKRCHMYPNYEYKIYSHLIYAKKFNVYFALSKKFSVLILNSIFQPTGKIKGDMRNITYMIFNSESDELITGGVAGTKIWKFQISENQTYKEMKSMSNYELDLRHDWKSVGGSWVKKIELQQKLKHLYCCSDSDIFCYNLEDCGKLLFHFERAHAKAITGCLYSSEFNLLITSSKDTTIKLWNIHHGLVETLTGHSKSITGITFYHNSQELIVSASSDGTVRLWSLLLNECLYILQVATGNGSYIQWSGASDFETLYLATNRNIFILTLSYLPALWSIGRTAFQTIFVTKDVGKASRVIGVGKDGTVKIYSRKTKALISSILTPPQLSPFDQILGFAYVRAHGTACMLLNETTLWIYFVRTNPACRMVEWNLVEIQEDILAQVLSKNKKATDAFETNQLHLHRSTQHPLGKEEISKVRSMSFVKSRVHVWSDDGFIACLIQDEFILLGLEDGRILFINPLERARIHVHFRAHRSPIVDLQHDHVYNCLMVKIETNENYVIQIWNLPDLNLLHEVFTNFDLICFARLSCTLFTGCKAGHVIVNPLDEYAVDDGPMTVKPPSAVVLDRLKFRGRKSDHPSDVVSIDRSCSRQLYCTASCDGVIKLWTQSKQLVVELNLEESVSAVCFLNQNLDLLCSMKNHLFVVHRSKYFSSYLFNNEATASDDSEGESVPESLIWEDPAMRSNQRDALEENITLDNYLMPFPLNVTEKWLRSESVEHAEERVESPEVEALLCDDDSQTLAPDDLLDSERDLSMASSFREDELDDLIRWTQSLHANNKLSTRKYQFPKLGHTPLNSPPHSSVTECTPRSVTPDMDHVSAAIEDRASVEKSASVEKEIPSSELVESRSIVKESRTTQEPEIIAFPRRNLKDAFDKIELRASDLASRPRVAPTASVSSNNAAVRNNPNNPTDEWFEKSRSVKKKVASSNKSRTKRGPPKEEKSSNTTKKTDKSENKVVKSTSSKSSEVVRDFSQPSVIELSLNLTESSECEQTTSDQVIKEEFTNTKHSTVRPSPSKVYLLKNRQPFLKSSDAISSQPNNAHSLSSISHKETNSLKVEEEQVDEEDDETSRLEHAAGRENVQQDTLPIRVEFQRQRPRTAAQSTTDTGFRARFHQHQNVDEFMHHQTKDHDFSLSKLLSSSDQSTLNAYEVIQLHNMRSAQRKQRCQSAAQKRREIMTSAMERWQYRSGHTTCLFNKQQKMLFSDTDGWDRSVSRPATAPGEINYRPSRKLSVSSSAVDDVTDVENHFTLSAERLEKRAQTPYRIALTTEIETPSPTSINKKADFDRSAMKQAMFKFPSAPSIPTRNYSYVLLRPDTTRWLPHKAQIEIPSLTEERLIRDRFPQFVGDWIGSDGALQPPRWVVQIDNLRQKRYQQDESKEFLIDQKSNCVVET